MLRSAILAISMMTHATLGCCFHHAHSCESNCCDLPTATASSCECGSHGDGERERPNDARVHREFRGADHSQHHGQHECEEGSCNFRTTESFRPFKVTNPQHFVCAFVFPQQKYELALGATNRVFPMGAGTACSGLRVHLLLDIWLI